MSNETTVKVNVEVDSAELESLNDLLEDLMAKGEEVGMAVSGSLGEIETAAMQVVMELGEATDAADDLAGSLDGVDSGGLSDAADGAGELADQLGGASEEAEKLSENTDTFSNNTMKWSGVSQAMGNISAKVGAANSQFISINETVGMVAVNTGYSTEQVRELAMSYTEVGTSANDAAIYLQRMQNAGLEPNTAAMDDAMNNAHMLQTAFHMSGSEADALMGALGRAGIGADNLSESFNALGYISAETNIDVSTFSSILTTSGANMDKYGVSADQAAVALSKINKRYRSARQAGSAFNKAVEESQGDVAKLEQLLDLEAGTLQNASAETAKAAGTVEGLSAAQEDAQGWTGKITAGLDALTMKISGTAGPISNFSAALSSTVTGATDVKSALSMVTDGFRGIRNFGFDGAKAALVSLKDTVLGAGRAAKSAALQFVGLAKKVALAGFNALKTVAMWMAAAAAKAAAAISAAALAIAEWAVASPILVIIIVIAALIAILIYLYFNSEQVREAINWLGEQLLMVGQMIWGGIIGALTALYEWFVQLGQEIYTFVANGIASIVNFVMMVVNAFLSFISYIAGLPGQISAFFSQMISNAVSWAGSMASQALSAGSKMVSNLIGQVSKLPSTVYSEFMKIVDKIKQAAVNIAAAGLQAGLDLVKAFFNGIGFHSPMLIRRVVKSEFEKTADEIPKSAKDAELNSYKWGTGVVNGFKGSFNNLIGSGVMDLDSNVFANSKLINATGNAQDKPQIVLNMEIGSVDNEDRIQEIVGTIKRELHWDNETAGRTM